MKQTHLTTTGLKTQTDPASVLADIASLAASQDGTFDTGMETLYAIENLATAASACCRGRTDDIDGLAVCPAKDAVQCEVDPKNWTAE